MYWKTRKSDNETLNIFINKKLCCNIIHLEKIKFTFKCSKFEQWFKSMEHLKMHLDENVYTKFMAELDDNGKQW